MQEDLDAGIESAQQQVEEYLENAKNTKIKSSVSNRKKLNLVVLCYNLFNIA